MIERMVMLALVGFLTACSGGRDSAAADLLPRGLAASTPWEQPVPRAQCGGSDAQETGFQGQVPLADRLSGRSLSEYNCNLELVGQYQGQGASWQVAWFDDCAYYGQIPPGGGVAPGAGEVSNPGAVVVDVSDPSRPVASAYLDAPATADPHESLKVNERRALLGAVDLDNEGFAVYDVSGDCSQPRLLATEGFAGYSGHEGEWAPDGRTYYGSNAGIVYAIDVDDPETPVIAGDMAHSTHGLSVSRDGNRAYLAATGADENGLRIVNVSEIQQRQPDPETTVIGEFFWTDGFAAQHTIPVTYDGVEHIIFVDELGGGSRALISAGGAAVSTLTDLNSTLIVGPIALGPAFACAEGSVEPYGIARIIDISDESQPELTAKLMLETNDFANCAAVLADTAGQAVFAYDSHYCGVDRTDDPTAVACGYQNSGIRVFDIRDPYRPQEIAYYIPPAQLMKQNDLPGSAHLGAKNADWCSAQVRFVPERGELWTTCQDNGFMVLRFTNGVWPFEE